MLIVVELGDTRLKWSELCYTIGMDTKEKDIKILAIVGMSGSGKSVVVDHLTSKGFPKVYFGGMIYNSILS